MPELTDAEARTIASAWHGGGGSALYRLASTGAIWPLTGRDGVMAEILECVAGSDDAGDREHLRRLGRYCIIAGKRGPVPGWGSMPWVAVG